jgi:hypothetical protein
MNKKKITIFLAVLLLLTTLATAFHHHDDGILHHNCPLCILCQQFSAVFWDSISFAVRNDVAELDLPKEILQFPSIIPASLYTRAPPA